MALAVCHKGPVAGITYAVWSTRALRELGFALDQGSEREDARASSKLRPLSLTCTVIDARSWLAHAREWCERLKYFGVRYAYYSYDICECRRPERVRKIACTDTGCPDTGCPEEARGSPAGGRALDSGAGPAWPYKEHASCVRVRRTHIQWSSLVPVNTFGGMRWRLLGAVADEASGQLHGLVDWLESSARLCVRVGDRTTQSLAARRYWSGT